MESMPYYVYILLCGDGSYYTGYTNDLKARLEMHREGRGSKYTRTRRPERIVYVEEFESRSEAMRREIEIKNLSHTEKQDLAKRSEPLFS